MSIFPTLRFVFFEHVELGEFDVTTRRQKIYVIYVPTDLPGDTYNAGEFYEFIGGSDVNLDEYLAYYIYRTGKVDSVEFDFWLNDEEGDAVAGGHFLEITIDDLEPGKIGSLISDLQLAIERELYAKAPGGGRKYINCTFETEYESSREQALIEYVKLLGLQGALTGAAARWTREEQKPERTFRKTHAAF